MALGCINQGGRSAKEVWGPDQAIPLFAAGQWVAQAQLDSLRKGRLWQGFSYEFSLYGFHTTTDAQGRKHISIPFLDSEKELEPFQDGWYAGGDTVSFSVAGKDTLAYFDFKGDGSGRAPHIRINSEMPQSGHFKQDWIYRSEYFAGQYRCHLLRPDSTFEIRLTSSGEVLGSGIWKAYYFDVEYEYPILAFQDKSGKSTAYAYITHSGIKNAFTLHTVLNGDDLLANGPGKIEFGDSLYKFVRE